MGRNHIIIYSLTFLLFSSCSGEINPEVEKQEIIDLINAETQAYMDYDFEKVISYYVHDSLNFRLTTGADDHIFLEGWNEVEDFFREELIENDPQRPPDTHVKVTKENYRIKVYEESAFVICDETWTYTTPDAVTQINSRQVRFLEKVDGEWKIAFLSFIGTSGYEEEQELQEMGLRFNSVN
jgi:hypothetical protein